MVGTKKTSSECVLTCCLNPFEIRAWFGLKNWHVSDEGERLNPFEIRAWFGPLADSKPNDFATS